MIDIAVEHGIKLQIGAQVGETAILSAAARHLNLAQSNVLYSEGLFWTAAAGPRISAKNASRLAIEAWDPQITGPGFGVTILEDRIHKYTQTTLECAQ